MANAQGMTGKDFRWLRKATATDAAPVYMGNIKTGKVTETFEYDDTTVPNTDSPGAIPARTSLPKGYAWSTNISGLFDAVLFKQMRADMKGGLPCYVRMLIAKSKALGGGYFDGAVWFENLETSYSDLGVVQVSGQLRGEGDLVWTEAAV